MVSLLDRFRFGMLDRRLISVDGKPVKAYLLQHDVWDVSINALVLVQMPHYAPFIPLRANDHQDGMGVPFRIGRLPETTLTLKLCVWHFCRQSHFITLLWIRRLPYAFLSAKFANLFY